MNPAEQKQAGGIPPTRCILWGGYAEGNTGDELTLAVALHDMQERYGDSIAILTANPGYTMRQFPGMEVIRYDLNDSISLRRRLSWKIALRIGTPQVWRYRLQDQSTADGSWLPRLRSCEMLYLVGGGYLTDLFNLDAHLLPVGAAKEAGAAVATAPLGLGPFRSRQAARKTAATLTGATLAVRDQASLDFCDHAGLPARLAKDDGFRAAEVIDLRPEPNAPRRLRPCIGLNISHQYGSSWTGETRSWWTTLVRTLTRAPVDIETFCFHADTFSDYERALECCLVAGLAPSSVREPRLDFRAACRQLADFDLIVSSRFHAVVVGNIMGKATFGVYAGDYYKHKMLAAAQDFPRSQALSLPEMNAVDAANAILKSLQALAGSAPAMR
jgi:polysaccharide pyruvyl transferase WcaK-like protein